MSFYEGRLMNEGCPEANVAYIFGNDVRKKSLSIHDQPIGYKWLWKDTSTNTYLVDGKGLWTGNRCISIGTLPTHPHTK